MSLWSGNDSIYEVRQEWTTPPPNPPTETITRYVAVNGQYLAKLVGGPIAMQPFFHHTDIVGTVRAVTDISGAVIARYAYEPFGSLTTASGVVDGELHRFTGKPSDLETSLSYFNARYYDPALGRFMSSDPAKEGLNWFVYCNGNPLMFIDQNGKFTIGVGACIFAAAGIRGAVTVTFVIDSKGSIGLLYSGAIGGGSPAGGISAVLSLTNAKSSSDLVGIGAETGGTAIVLGVEYATGATKDGNWNGVTFSGGNFGSWIALLNSLTNLLPVSVEYHFEFSATGYIPVSGWLAEKAREYALQYTIDQINALSQKEKSLWNNN